MTSHFSTQETPQRLLRFRVTRNGTMIFAFAKFTNSPKHDVMRDAHREWGSTGLVCALHKYFLRRNENVGIEFWASELPRRAVALEMPTGTMDFIWNQPIGFRAS